MVQKIHHQTLRTGTQKMMTIIISHQNGSKTIFLTSFLRAVKGASINVDTFAIVNYFLSIHPWGEATGISIEKTEQYLREFEEDLEKIVKQLQPEQQLKTR